MPDPDLEFLDGFLNGFYRVELLNAEELEARIKEHRRLQFGFGCPFCELLLDQYPEDRNEGGIE